jgi:hypothetical protein
MNDGSSGGAVTGSVPHAGPQTPHDQGWSREAIAAQHAAALTERNQTAEEYPLEEFRLNCVLTAYHRAFTHQTGSDN